MTIEMFQNVNDIESTNNNLSLENNFLNFTGAPTSSNGEHKHFSNDEDYFTFVCEYKRTPFSLTYNIVTGILGLFLAYRTVVRIRGFNLFLFLFFYLIVVALALFEILVHIVVSKEKSKKICIKYYRWLHENQIVKIIISIVRWILFAIIIFIGIGSFFSEMNDSNHLRNNKKGNLKYRNLINNRNNNRNNNNNNNNNRNNNNRNYNNNRNNNNNNRNNNSNNGNKNNKGNNNYRG